MAEKSNVVMMPSLKAERGVVRVLQAAAVEVREATTGRVVQLPQVWAVAAPAPSRVRPESAATRRLEAVGQAGRKAVAAEELGFYRKYTEALLRRYVQMSMEAGRVSSMMGREVLGGRASSYRVHGFDDAVIFRLDVEKCLKQLDAEDTAVIRRIAIQEYTHVEAAELLGVSLRTAGTRYGRALDRLTAILLRVRLLEPLRGVKWGEMGNLA